MISASIAPIHVCRAAPQDTQVAPMPTGDGASTLQILTPGRASNDLPGAQPRTLPGASQRPTAADPSSETPASDNESLTPVPEPENSSPPAVEVASFSGVTPGVTTLTQIQEAWGQPRELANRNGNTVHLYTVEPFDRVEATISDGRVASLVIRLDRSFPAHQVAEQLELSNLQPVLVSNALGEILGQSFPERGVLFAFEPSDTPGRPSMQVVQIILEPVSAEPFVLRAETLMDSQLESSIRDLDQAVKLDPENARAHWLRARALSTAGDVQDALKASGEALRLEPANAQYRLTQAQILGQLRQFAEAIKAAQRAVADGTQRPHVQAQALCLLGDLESSKRQPDYRQAIAYHLEAVKIADPLAVSRHPAVRLAAKEALIKAHLGAGADIAWGPWEQKRDAVPRWLNKAAALAEDLVENDGGSFEHPFRVAARALAAYVGLQGQLDPTTWAQRAIDSGQDLLASLPESIQKRQARWELGAALYDAVQICQMRGDHAKALEYGTRAAGYLETPAEEEPAGPTQRYLLGRLYFRMGAIQAVGSRDHPAAVEWFDRAVPILVETAGRLDAAETGRLGETLVSMGVSYWEVGQRDRAVQLTRHGVALVEGTVQAGAMKPRALEIPYSNLATMLRQSGETDEADKYLLQAKKLTGTTIR
jgi:tetratricopeptide (TPR) repeat protein